MRIHGPAVSPGLAADLITGKPWVVYIHGGEFKYYSAVNANYAMLSSRVAAAAGMGILAVDYRTLGANDPKVGDHGPCSKHGLFYHMLALITSDCVHRADDDDPKKFPIALDDVVDAFKWLKSYSPSSLHLYGNPRRRRDCHSAVPPSTLSRCSNRNGERAPAE